VLVLLFVNPPHSTEDSCTCVARNLWGTCPTTDNDVPAYGVSRARSTTVKAMD